jgi:hypothetical protein
MERRGPVAKRTIRRAARVPTLPTSSNGHDNGRPRFEVYVIDSGWKSEAGEVVRESLDLFAKYLQRHRVYVLTEDQSEEFLQDHPQLLGKDPIIAVLDRKAIERRSENGIGARLLLGRVHSRTRVLALLKMLLRIVNTRHLAEDLPGAIRREVHREGVSGAIEVIISTTGHIETESGH